ncbi:MAG TPA: LamG domain-containing protein [Lacibacter sp.]|nr:LamG domain-containing protein [Lacibacter sp.]HMO88558.1 LamG domain-containing protein [Lacibacter sp.]HMP86027.1 LamG domain-containing protein [Lacibacter sp.]
MRTLTLLLCWLSLSAVTYAQTLVAHYPFNGNANDASGNGRNPVLISSGATLTTDRFGQPDRAYAFDGTSGYIKYAADGLPTGDRTISLWFNVPAVDNRPGFLGYGGDGNCGSAFFMGLNLLGDASYHLQGHCRVNEAQYPYGTAPLNNWVHWVATVQGNTHRIYINGVVKSSSATFTVPTAVTGKDFVIGVITSLTGTAPYTDINIKYTKGKLDDIRMYNAALSDAQVLQLYREEATGLVVHYPFNGNAEDTAMFRLHGTPVSVTYTSDRFNNSNKAVQMNGTSSVVTVKDTPLLRINNELTLSAWVKRTRFGIDMILEKGGDWTGSTTNYGMGLHNINSNMFYFFFKGGWRGTPGVNDFNWHYYTVVAKNGDADPQLYIDGVLKPVQYREGAGSVELAVSAADLHIGAQLGSPAYYGANMLDEVKIYNRLLSSAEVLNNYRKEGTGLAAWYPLNGNLLDSSGNANHGTGVNGPVFTNDRLDSANRALRLQAASTQYVEVPDHPSIQIGTELSISVWVKRNTLTTIDEVVNKGGDWNQNNCNYGLVFTPGELIFLYDGGYHLIQAPQDLNWHHYAITTYQGSPDVKFYVDGNYVPTWIPQGSINFKPSSDAPLRIGAKPGIHYSNNTIDDVRIYNRVLAPNEIRYLAAQPILAAYLPLNGNTRDVSGNGRNGTVTAATLTTDKYSNPNSAYRFYGNGTLSGIVLDNSAGLNFMNQPFTLSAWVKYSHMGGSEPKVIVGKHYTCVYSGYLLSVLNNSIEFAVAGSGNSFAAAVTTETFNDNKWHHVVAVYNGSNQLSVYVDGVLKASATGAYQTAAQDAPVKIGGATIGCGDYGVFDGDIDEVKMYSTALTPPEIILLYQQSRGSGYATRFEGNSTNHVQLTRTVEPPPAITLEAWVQHNGTAGRQWILAGSAANTWQWGIEGNKMILGLLNGGEVLSGDAVFNDGKWHHLAVSFSGNTVAFYCDGFAAGTGTLTPAGTTSGPYTIGNRAGTTQSFDGVLDELRLWGAALPPELIRNWMHRKVTRGHPQFEALGHYYNFDEASVYHTYDLRSGLTGLLQGGISVVSGAPIGDTSAVDFTNPVKTATVMQTVNEQLTVTATSGNPAGLAVYVVKDVPVSLEGTSGTGGIGHYYGVQLIGGGSPSYTAVYQYGGNPLVTPLIEPGLTLFRRDNNSQQWMTTSAILNTTAKTLTVTGQNTEYILGSTGFPLAVEEPVERPKPVVLYPNPARGQVTLRGVETFGRLQVIDLSGKMVRDQLINRQSVVQLNLSGLRGGLYLIRLSDGRDVQVFRLVVAE